MTTYKETFIPHIYRNRFLRDSGGNISVSINNGQPTYGNGNANYAGEAAYAAAAGRLYETHSIFGVPFDGTQDVDGDLFTSGNITFGEQLKGPLGMFTQGVDTQNLIVRGTSDLRGSVNINFGAIVYNPSDSGSLDVGVESTFDENVSFLKNITVGNKVTAANVLTTNLEATQATLANLYCTNADIGDLDVDTVDAHDITTENLTVTGVAHFFKLVIDELKASKGMVVVSPGNATFVKVEKITKTVNLPYYGSNIDVYFWRCYFLAEEIDDSGNTIKTIYNTFEEGDNVVCHTFNLGSAGIYNNASNKFYWGTLWPCDANPSVSTNPVGKNIDGIERTCHYIDIIDEYYADANEHYTKYRSTSEPEAGDEVAVLGNISNPERQNAIIISAMDTTWLDRKTGTGQLKAPYIVQYKGINPVYSNQEDSHGHKGWDLYPYRWSVISKDFNIFKGSMSLENGTSIEDAIAAGTPQVHIAYANSADGQTDFTKSGSVVAGTSYDYIGFCYNHTVSDAGLLYTDYTWTRVKGADGAQGAQGYNGQDGLNGRDGVNGADGTNEYFHVAYANKDTNGNIINFSTSDPTNREWLGTYVDSIQADSNDTTKYTWMLFKGAQGEDGQNGIPGTNGADGRTSYLHIKYSNDAGTTFTSNNGETPGYYLGQYVDFIQADSNDPSSYTWALIKGVDGTDGQDGTGVRILGYYEIFADFADAINNNTLYSEPEVAGDAYIVGGYLYTYTGSTWIGCGRIKGEDGRDGTNGSNGRPAYLHIAWANSADGVTDFTTVQVSGVEYRYMGVYTSAVSGDSTNPSDYEWTRIRGNDGTNGTNGRDGLNGRDGVDGADGTSEYFHVAYGNKNSQGQIIDFSRSNPTNREWLGTYVDSTQADSTNPSDYTWMKIKGEEGIPGTNGTNGQTSYLHIKYSNDAGQTFTANNGETPGYYLGQYVDFTEADSNDITKYKWALIHGEDGEDGTGIQIKGTVANASLLPMTGNTTGDAWIVGKNLWIWDGSDWSDMGQIKGDDGRDGLDGVNGTSAYVHIAWANSANGSVDFTTVKVSGMTYKYMGIYADSNIQDSNDYTKYVWTLIKGADAIQYYTWIKYADDNQGTGFSDSPISNGQIKKWIGFAYNKTEQVESNNWRDYTWSKYAGDDGANGSNGIDGAPGADGITYYTWIKYADTLPNSSSVSIYDTPTNNTYYIGIAVNKTSPTESNNYWDYTWSKWRGDTGVAGPQGPRGTDGDDGDNARCYFLLENYAYAHIVLQKDGSNQPVYDGNGNPQWQLNYAFEYNVLYIDGMDTTVLRYYTTPTIQGTGLTIQYKLDNQSSWSSTTYDYEGRFTLSEQQTTNSTLMAAKTLSVRLINSSTGTIYECKSIPVVIDANGVYVSQEHLLSVFTAFASNTNSSLSTLSQNYSTLQQSVNSISSTVSGHTTSIGNLNSSFSTLSSNLSTLQSQVNAIQSINSIGATNLLRNSMFNDVVSGVPKKWSAWGSPSTRVLYQASKVNWIRVQGSYKFEGISQNSSNRWDSTIDEGIKPNKKYSISVDAWGSGNFGFGIHWCNTAGTIIDQEWKNFTLTGTSTRYTATFTAPNNSNVKTFNLMIGSGSVDGTHNIYMSHPKFELGEISTDWSTSPFDTTDEFAIVNEEISNITQTQSQIQSTVSNHTTLINYAQQTATGAQGAVNSLSGTVSTHTTQISQITQNANSISSRVSTLESTVANIDMSNAKKVTVDARSLSVNNIYPVIIDFNRYNGSELIRCQVQRTLNSGYGVPSYSNHQNGFVCNLDWTTRASGWGTNQVEKNWSTSDTTRYINDYEVNWTTDNSQPIIGSIGQNTEMSREVVYVRGGSKYDVITSFKDATITLYSNGYSWSQTGSDNNTYSDYRPVKNKSYMVIPRKDTMTYSEIVQKSDAIELSVYDKLLNRTGIDVTNGAITLNANNTTVVGNLNITDTSNGITVYETATNNGTTDKVARINLQPKTLPSYSTIQGNDKFTYARCSGSYSPSSSPVSGYYGVYTTLNITTASSTTSTYYLEKGTVINLDGISCMIYGISGSSYVSVTPYFEIEFHCNANGKTYYINGSNKVSRSMSYSAQYQYYYSSSNKLRFVVPYSGNYTLYVWVRTYSSNSNTNNTYLNFNTRLLISDSAQTYIGTDGIYSRAGAYQYMYNGPGNFTIQQGLAGLRVNVPTTNTYSTSATANINGRIEVGAGIVGSIPNPRTLWMPIWNYTPTISVGTGTSPYLYTSQTIYLPGSSSKWAWKMDPLRDQGIILVQAGGGTYGDSEGWIVLPPVQFTYDGYSASLPVGYTVTIIKCCSQNIYVTPYRGSSSYGAKIIDANMNENDYVSMNSNMYTRDTFIYTGHWSNDEWISMHDH